MAQQQSPRRVATIIWAALVFGVLSLLAVSFLVQMPGDARLAGVLLPLAGGLSLVTAAASWLWAVRMRPPASPPAAARSGAIPSGPEAFALTRLIVASALCEGAALFAIVAFLVTSDAVMLLPFAVSFAALVAHFPGDRHWARLCGGPASAATRRNPMIRG